MIGHPDENVIKSMGAFGGGIASTGSVCGCLVGGIAFISSLYSRGNLQGKENPAMWRLSYKLTRRFEDLTREFGSMNCRDIARVNWSDREETRHFYNDPGSRRELCVKLVGDTAQILGEIVQAHFDKEGRPAS